MKGISCAWTVMEVVRSQLLLLSLLVVVSGIFVWAGFIRKAGSPYAPAPRRSDRRAKGIVEMKARKRRKRRRGTNPTLAETGGLPPIRSNVPESPRT
jgi:hypothetical protein